MAGFLPYLRMYIVKKLTASILAKAGNLTQAQIGAVHGYSRQWLQILFNRDRSAYQDVLFEAMRVKLNKDIEEAIEKRQTVAEIREEMKALLESKLEDHRINTPLKIADDLTAAHYERIKTIKAMK